VLGHKDRLFRLRATINWVNIGTTLHMVYVNFCQVTTLIFLAIAEFRDYEHFQHRFHGHIGSSETLYRLWDGLIQKGYMRLKYSLYVDQILGLDTKCITYTEYTTF
jgi:hypothetical protein